MSPNSLNQKEGRNDEKNNNQPGSPDIKTRLCSQYEGLVPDGVQSLLLYVCRVDFVVRYSVLHHRFTGFGPGPARSTLLLVLQYGQHAVWVTETCSKHTRDLKSQSLQEVKEKDKMST